jgi:hypothetical protein
LHARHGSEPSSRLPLYAAAGTAIAMFAAGAYMIHVDGTGTCGLGPGDCPYVEGTGGAGWALLGAGAAAAFTVYWHVKTPAPSRVGISAAPGGSLITLGGRF